jgi:alpha,alpha-trehalose phosphorylase
MFLPYDEELDIHLQDEHFLSKKKWDFENTPEEKYPLLLHYHPLTIYRYQVLKQADTVLAHLLLPHGISKETLSNSYDYYKAITTHDSSLSACVYGMMASKLGRSKEALDFFKETVYLDLEDMHGNTKDGLHMANLAGSILSIYKGFLGIEVHSDDVCIAPNIPSEFGTVEVKVKLKGRTIGIKVFNNIELCLLEGKALEIKVYNKSYELKDQLTLEVTHD